MKTMPIVSVFTVDGAERSYGVAVARVVDGEVRGVTVSEGHPERITAESLAAEIRGALADAFHAGAEDERYRNYGLDVDGGLGDRFVEILDGGATT